MQNVAHTCSIVGVFDSAEKARLVREDLMRAGFAEADIQTQAQAGTAYSTQGGDGGFWDSIKELFGAQDVYAYQEAERQGRYLLVINTSEDPAEIERAADIMRRYNPIDIDESCAPATTGGLASGQRRKEGEAIPVIQEEMRVGKRQQMAGGVRLYSHVTETPVEEDISLREEHVHVERRPADRPAGPDAFRESEIEAVETKEVPVVSKEARVVEEVTLDKEAEEHTETVRGKVRRQDVKTERLDADEPKRTDPPAGT